jgi:hypothetical protein
MRLRKSQPVPEPVAGHPGGVADKLSHVRPIFHDDDERQSAADRDTYHNPMQSIYAPVPLPRWLKPRKSKKRL